MKRKVLLIFPTETEAGDLFNSSKAADNQRNLYIGDSRFDLLISGVGMMQTAYALTKALASGRYDFVVHGGIAGSYHQEPYEGEVVNVVSESIDDMGVENHKGFYDVFESGIMNRNTFPFENGILKNPTLTPDLFSDLTVVKAVTVSRLYEGREKNYERAVNYQAQIETMEGAAVFYVCLMEKIPFVQLRAISNRAGVRDKSKWHLNESITALNRVINNYISSL